MTTTYMAQARLSAAQQALGQELCQTLDRINDRLSQLRYNGMSRELAELREAKSLVACLKYPDATDSVRRDELAWAVARIMHASPTTAQSSALYIKLAGMLEMDLSQPHPLPADLSRKINNAMPLFERHRAGKTLAEAA